MITKNNELRPKVLMIGPGRKVQGGISTVVNTYYELKLNQTVSLKYIPTMFDTNKVLKLFVAFFSYIYFCLILNNYDIIHIHMAAQASFYRKAYFVKKAYKANKKIIVHQHAGSFDSFYLKECNEKKRDYVRYIFSLTNKVVVLSEEWARFFEKNICDVSKIEVINNGIIPPNYIKKDYKDHNILFLGRLTKAKGVFELLEAINIVSKKFEDVKLYIAGAGEELENCKTITKKLGIEKNIVFLGWITDIDTYMKKCSMFILPSYFECMPMSVLEAMSYGLATISTNVGGIPTIINNTNGFLIEKKSVRAIVNSLFLLIDDHEKKQTLGEKARQEINLKYKASDSIVQLVYLYSSLI